MFETILELSAVTLLVGMPVFFVLYFGWAAVKKIRGAV